MGSDRCGDGAGRARRGAVPVPYSIPLAGRPAWWDGVSHVVTRPICLDHLRSVGPPGSRNTVVQAHTSGPTAHRRLFRGGFEGVGREGCGGGLLGRVLLVRGVVAKAFECVSPLRLDGASSMVGRRLACRDATDPLGVPPSQGRSGRPALLQTTDRTGCFKRQTISPRRTFEEFPWAGNPSYSASARMGSCICCMVSARIDRNDVVFI